MVNLEECEEERIREIVFKAHFCLRDVLNAKLDLSSFDATYNGHALNFYVTAKKGTILLGVEGPVVSRRRKFVEYSICLPDHIPAMDDYLDYVFGGIKSAMVSVGGETNVEEVKKMCVEEIHKKGDEEGMKG